MAKYFHCSGLLMVLSGFITACQPVTKPEDSATTAQGENYHAISPATKPVPLNYHLHIAAVPNLSGALPIIANHFQQAYPNIRVTYSFAAAENIYKEVVANRQRYDIVLSDNQGLPYKLSQSSGYVKKNDNTPYQRLQPFTYAQGQLVIYSKKYDMNISPVVIFDENLLENKPFSIAVAKLDDSAYGMATKEWLMNQNLYPKIEDNLIELDNFSDIIALSHEGEADFSIANLAQVLNQTKQLTVENVSNNTSSYVILPKNSYPAILQDGVTLRTSDASDQFVAYLQSSKSQEILSEAGFLPICTKVSLLPACKKH